MALVLIIDLLSVGLFCFFAMTKGLEEALPFFTFVVVFFPIESRIPLGFFDLTTERLMLMVLIVVYVIIGKGNDPSPAKLSNPLKVLILLHIVWCTISTMASVAPMMSFKKALSVILEYYSLYIIYLRVITKVSTIHKILWAMVIALTICSVFGVYETYYAWNLVDLLPRVEHRFGSGDMSAGAAYVDVDRGVRVMATFDHPILFGAALAMTIIMALYLLSVTEKGWQKKFLWLGLILMFFNVYKSISRGPWLDVILGCVLLFVFGGRRVRIPLIMIGTLSVASMIIRPGIYDTVAGIYQNTFDLNTGTGDSLEYRPAMQRAVYHNLMAHPQRAVWGYGLETFYDVGIVGDFLGQPHTFLSADDAWVEIMEETGFVGLFLLALLLAKPLLIAWKDFRKFHGPDSDLFLLFVINFLIFYIQMYSVGMYSWGQNGYMLWILIASSMAFHGMKQAEASSTVIAEKEQMSSLPETGKRVVVV